MASYVETTAVSLRKGTTEENLNFTGVLGEVVADLGSSTDASTLGTDLNTTLRLHNGITKGGIPMARADLANVTTEALAKNRNLFGDKNLAYANLENIEPTGNIQAQQKIVTTLSNYGLISEAQLEVDLGSYAKANTSNINTKNLVSPVLHNGTDNNFPLAYANTSNINTKDLVDSNLHNGTNNNEPLAYAVLKNVNTTNLTLDETERPNTMSGPVLAKSDLSNVSDANLETIVQRLDIETTNNKDTSIPNDSALVKMNHYPNTLAVKTYVDAKVIQTGALQKDFSNATNYDVLYANSSVLYKLNTAEENIISAGTQFTINEEINTPIYLSSDPQPLGVQVISINADTTPNEIALTATTGKENLSQTPEFTVYSVTGGALTVRISSTIISNTDTYKYAIISAEKTGKGFEEGTYYPQKDIFYSPNLSIIIKECDVNGGITKFDYNYNLVESAINEQTIQITSAKNTKASIKVKQSNILPSAGGAYLLKTDLTNLYGMSEEEAKNEQNAPWKINHDNVILPIAEDSLPELVAEAEKYKITTNYSVWQGLKNLQVAINSSKQDKLTQPQLDAINSGITADLVTQIGEGGSKIILREW